MTSPWSRLSAADLRQLGGALQAGRLTVPFSAVSLQRYLAADRIQAAIAESQRLYEVGMTGTQVAYLLAALANDRADRPPFAEVLDVVATGPEAPGVALRDTAVVVRELFANARQSMLVVGYAVHQGRSVFRALAERMDQRPGLDVRLCLHVPRPWRDETPANVLLQRFAERFKTQEWPGSRWPAAEAAQERNIEVGVLLRVPALAEQLSRHFQALMEAGVLRELAGPLSTEPVEGR